MFCMMNGVRVVEIIDVENENYEWKSLSKKLNKQYNTKKIWNPKALVNPDWFLLNMTPSLSNGFIRHVPHSTDM